MLLRSLPTAGSSRIFEDNVLAIIGVGLIGGSIGLAAKARGLFREVRGTTRRKSTLEAALKLGAVDSGFSDASQAADGANLVVVATSVSQIPPLCLEAAAVAAEGACITDVGSVKARIVDSVESKMPSGRLFIGSHPLAGSEKTGVVNARADLLDGATCIITPSPNVPDEDADRLSAFWQALGMKVFRMCPSEHDSILADVSHLPHLVASALVESIEDVSLPFGASGLRDTTRVASGDAALWRDIIEANQDEVLKALERFDGSVETLKGLMLRGDFNGLEEYLADSAEKRKKRFGESAAGGDK